MPKNSSFIFQSTRTTLPHIKFRRQLLFPNISSLVTWSLMKYYLYSSAPKKVFMKATLSSSNWSSTYHMAHRGCLGLGIGQGLVLPLFISCSGCLYQNTSLQAVAPVCGWYFGSFFLLRRISHNISSFISLARTWSQLTTSSCKGGWENVVFHSTG
jgi:hypothetical protein